MRVTITTKDLSDMLKIVGRAIERKSVSPYMESVLLRAENGTLTAYGTNGTMLIAHSAECETQECGEAAVDGKMIEAMVAKLTGAGAATVIETKDTRMTVKTGKSKTTLTMIPSDSFKFPCEMKPKVSFKISGAEIANALNSVQYAVSTDNNRVVLTGVLMEVSGTEVSTLALDGFRMAKNCKTLQENITEYAPAVIPGKSAICMAGIAGGVNDDVTIGFDERAMEMHAGNTIVRTQLLDGNYIDYKKIVPKVFDTSVRFNLRDMKSAVDRAMLAAEKNNLVKITPSEDQLTIQGNSEVVDVVETIEAESHGNPITVAFNGKYIQSALNAMDADQVDMQFTTPTSPAVMHEDGNSGCWHLMLPVRVQG